MSYQNPYYDNQDYNQGHNYQQQPPMNPYGYPPTQPYEQQPVSYPPNYNQGFNNLENQANYNDKEKFSEKVQYNDVWAAIFFIVQLLAFIVFSVFMLKEFKNTKNNDGGSKDEDDTTFANKYTYITFAVSGATSFILSGFYILLMQRMPEFLIRVSFWFSIAVYLAAAVFYILNKAIFIGVVFGILGLLYIFLYFNWRSRIPLASLMLKTIAKFTRKYHGTILLALVFLVIELAYLVFWVFTLISAIQKYSNNDSNCHTNRNGQRVCKTNGALYAIYVFMAFNLFWTSQLLKDIVHMTISGTYASHHFFPVGSRYTTLSSLKRSLTTSFGSACFGSLLVSLIRLIRNLIQNAGNSSESGAMQFVACCLACILAQFEHLLEYFNLYAYAYCAMYGKPYLESGKATWNMIKDRGVDAIINDNLINNVLVLGSILISVISALIAYIYIAAVNPPFNTNGEYSIPLVIVSFILAMLLNSIVSQVIESANVCFFVCIAEEPEALATQNPELYEKIRQVYPRVVQSV